MADGSIIAPLSRCEPVVLPFSMSATGTSPSSSASCGSSSRSCISRIAHASPPGPPPTITTPTSIRSSSGSVGGPTNSLPESTGGGNSAGVTPIAISTALLRLNGRGELRQDLVEVAHDAEVRELEDRRVLVLVDCDDVLRGLHAHLVLDRSGDASREVELGRDRLAGLPDLRRVRVPARVDDGARGRHGPAERIGELLGELEVLGLTETAAATHEDVGVLDVHIGAALLAALYELGLGGPVGQRDVDLLDLRRTVAGLVHLEGVQAADDDARLAHVVDVDDGRV